jgi:HPt (histidine-containing phosphotransfer) domain-containing protein
MGQSSSNDHSVPCNIEELFQRCLGHIDFVERILDKFQVRFEDDLAELEEGLEAGDAEAVTHVAHRLKGAAANVAAPALRARLAEIERLGREGRLSEIALHAAPIRAEWAQFVEHVASVDLIEASIANERRATSGSPDPRAFTPELPNTSCAGFNKATSY